MVIDITGWYAERSKAWAERVAHFGADRAVYNIGHSDSELAAVTDKQRRFFEPLLRAAVRPGDRDVLDFGCGHGRWSDLLMCVVPGRVAGVDPTPEMIELARRRHTSVPLEYHRTFDGMLPFTDRSFGVLWCCLSLSTVLDDDILRHELGEVARVLRPGALVVLVDNTQGADGKAPRVDSPFSRSRTVAEYQALFDDMLDCRLRVACEYEDLGECITAMTGRTGQDVI